jgi:dienelactone hydrolase
MKVNKKRGSMTSVKKKGPFEGVFYRGNRALQVEVIRPSKGGKFPVILFSSGWGENFRFYHTILKRLAEEGYIIINIDHYYCKDTAPHTAAFAKKVINAKTKSDKTNSTKKEAVFMRIKAKALNLYYRDILHILSKLDEILINIPEADLNNIALMGHSLGGNAGKKVIETLAEENQKHNIKALVAFDTRFNQLGLKITFELPTLLLGAWHSYQKPDPLRVLPKQKNLKFIMLDHATHVSFDDISIMSVLKQDLYSLTDGLNYIARHELEENIHHIEEGDYTRFGEKVFLGNKNDMKNFLSQLNDHVHEFLKSKLK